jgi:hypothetical protein
MKDNISDLHTLLNLWRWWKIYLIGYLGEAIEAIKVYMDVSGIKGNCFGNQQLLGYARSKSVFVPQEERNSLTQGHKDQIISKRCQYRIGNTSFPLSEQAQLYMCTWMDVHLSHLLETSNIFIPPIENEIKV